MKMGHCDADWPEGKQTNVFKFGVNTLLGNLIYWFQNVLWLKPVLIIITCSSYFQLDCLVTLLLVGLKEVTIIHLLLQGE